MESQPQTYVQPPSLIKKSYTKNNYQCKRYYTIRWVNYIYCRLRNENQERKYDEINVSII